MFKPILLYIYHYTLLGIKCNEDGITSTSSICSNNDTIDLNNDLMDSVLELMKGFKVIKALKPACKKKTLDYWLIKRTLSKFQLRISICSSN